MTNAQMKARRLAKGLTSVGLARLVGLSATNVCRIEGGARPAYSSALRIAEALGCNVCDLWPGCALRGLIDIPAVGKAVQS